MWSPFSARSAHRNARALNEYNNSMKIQHDRLRPFIADIFHRAGCDQAEAGRIATHLVEANLVGHDSHGVIRVPTYVQWLKAGKVRAGRSIQVAFENDAIA